MFNRKGLMMLAHLFAVPLVLFGFAGATAPAQGAGGPAGLQFASEPLDSLVRRLEAADLDASAVALMPTTLKVARQERWLPDARASVQQLTLVNAGQTPIVVGSTVPATWTFRLRDAQDSGYEKLTYRADTWYGSTYWTGPDWTRMGKDWHHPGQYTPAVRRFTAPSDGHLMITGRVYKAHVAPTDGVRMSIVHRNHTVWQAEIEGADAKGVEPNVALDVRAGDSIRFVVHKRGEIACDTTHWDPVITYADGRRWQASEGFSTRAQGENGWWYEMQRDAQSGPEILRAYTFTRDLALRELALEADRSATLDSKDDLPLLVIADGRDQSGIVAALDGKGPWSCKLELTADTQLRLRWTSGEGQTVAPGGTMPLPRAVLAAYSGQWLAGLATMARLVQSGELPATGEQVTSALGRIASANPGPTTELDLWLLIQAEWRQEDKVQETADSYAGATSRHLKGAQSLLADLQAEHGGNILAEEEQQLRQLAEKVKTAGVSLETQRCLYQSVRTLKRRIALANPLVSFDRLLFAKRVPTSYSHLVMQYYGWRARPGGSLFVLDRPGYSLACRDILHGQLGEGNVLEPRLSYDARRIVFSFVRTTGKDRDPLQVTNDVDGGFYHIFAMNVDGSGLKQLSDGRYDDLMPTWLPDGGIAFSSTRRRGYARCFGPQFSPRWDVYTLHRMETDGSHLRTLSFHDTNEWFPAVSQTGHILYARWDYIDRDAVTHQNLWASRPDGTNPMAVWGNATPSPHCTFQIQPIPNSNKILFTASAHHSVAGGSIAIVDPAAGDNGHQAITRITPEIPFPEAEGMEIRQYYESPWPLSEKYYLVSYSPKPLVWEPGANDRDALGIYLLDRFGNREIIYRDPAIGSTNACPLVPRPMPPVLPSMLPKDAPPEGEMLLADVYRGLGNVPRGAIRELRIVQIFPKTTPVANTPAIGMALEENARAVLGTVPVEADGSARFTVPAHKPILFQALDQDGFAYQTMRTITYVQSGEQITCVGCHENRMSAPMKETRPKDFLALRRGPSAIDPGELGGRPFSYMSVVQPVLDRHCVRCHGGEKLEGQLDLTGKPQKGFSKSYCSLMRDRDFWHVGTNPQNAAEALVPRFGGRNQVQVTPPGGMYGARGSRLVKVIRSGHHDVSLAPGELRRLAAWIDLNAIFYGAYLPADQARQLQGQEVGMPKIQ